MITIQKCGHSRETTDRRFQPEECWYCLYIQNHPRKPLYVGNSTIQKRATLRKRMKDYWTTKKGQSPSTSRKIESGNR